MKINFFTLMIKMFLLRFNPEAKYRTDKQQKTLNIVSDSFPLYSGFRSLFLGLDDLNYKGKCLFNLGSISYHLYKEPSIISGTGPAIWTKTNFGPTGHHQPLSSLLPRICTFPSHSALITSIVSKLRPFSFIFNQGNREQ
jgi:hypothetical protein